jgi:hypothetical protein
MAQRNYPAGKRGGERGREGERVCVRARVWRRCELSHNPCCIRISRLPPTRAPISTRQITR